MVLVSVTLDVIFIIFVLLFEMTQSSSTSNIWLFGLLKSLHQYFTEQFLMRSQYKLYFVKQREAVPPFIHEIWSGMLLSGFTFNNLSSCPIWLLFHSLCLTLKSQPSAFWCKTASWVQFRVEKPNNFHLILITAQTFWPLHHMMLWFGPDNTPVYVL